MFGVWIFDFRERKKVKLRTVEPEYNEEHDCYQLPFYGYLLSYHYAKYSLVG